MSGVFCSLCNCTIKVGSSKCTLVCMKEAVATAVVVADTDAGKVSDGPALELLPGEVANRRRLNADVSSNRNVVAA